MSSENRWKRFRGRVQEAGGESEAERNGARPLRDGRRRWSGEREAYFISTIFLRLVKFFPETPLASIR
jgi:hypothetical protein